MIVSNSIVFEHLSMIDVFDVVSCRQGTFSFHAVQLCTVEALSMHWLKREIWKVDIAIVGMLLLLVLMVWVPVSAAGAYEGASGLATPGTVTVQATPTEDATMTAATMTALNKEKLNLDIEKDRSGIDKDRSDIFWAWASSGTIIVGVVGAMFAFFQFLSKLLAEKFERRKRKKSAFKPLLGD